MRKIKFRAWLKPDGFMADVGEIHFCRGGIIAHGPGVHLGNGWASCNYPFNHECAIVLMQFTGLYDKNGKEIFEGDVVKQDDYIGYVEYDINTASFKGVSECGYFFLLKDKIEVIGNIFENPHLLEQNND